MKMQLSQWIAGCWLAAAATGLGALPPVECRVELDRGVLPAGQEQTAVIKVTLEPPDAPREEARPPVNLCLVLDRSGSMSGSKIANARDAAVEALRRLGPKDMFSMVIYDHQVETIVPAQAASNVEWIEGRIRSIRPGGNTALYGGVSQGVAEIRKHLNDGYVNRVILLSDGIANVGPSSPSDLGRLGASLMKEGVSVTTVGLGTDYNEDLMTLLAQASDGNTYFVESAVDLPRIFGAELGDVLTVVAKKVELDIEFSNGVRPVRIIGRDGRLKEDGVEIQLNQLYGGQQKYALVEVTIPAGSPEDTYDIARARVTYEDSRTSESVSSDGKASVGFSRDAREVRENANRAVQSAWIQNEIAVAKDETVSLMDDNRPAAAVDNLQRVGQKLSSYADQYKLDLEVQEDASQLLREAEELEADGMDKVKRKRFRTDSYQQRNQQMSQ